MACQCDEKYHSESRNLLPGGVIQVQVNCLQCGSGWAYLVEEHPEQDDDE